jgi:hypothetical protein
LDNLSKEGSEVSPFEDKYRLLRLTNFFNELGKFLILLSLSDNISTPLIFLKVFSDIVCMRESFIENSCNSAKFVSMSR